MAIQMRRGALSNLDTSKLVAGEIVMSTDTGFVGIAKAPNDVLELAKKDDIPDEVIANPSGTATDDLTKIKIGNTVYGIEGGSGEVVEMTYAQYQALTPQQKMDGTVRYVSDYPSGGGSLPDYSTTEQRTGQKWIDGKDIYFKTLDVDCTGNMSKSVSLVGVNIDMLVKAEGVMKITPTQGTAYYEVINHNHLKATGNELDIGNTNGFMAITPNSSMVVRMGVTLASSYISSVEAFITLYYTKN